VARDGSDRHFASTAFNRGLAEAGYVVGRNVNLEYRSAENDRDQLRMLVAEFVREQVAVIVAATGRSAPEFIAYAKANPGMWTEVPTPPDAMLIFVGRDVQDDGGCQHGSRTLSQRVACRFAWRTSPPAAASTRLAKPFSEAGSAVITQCNCRRNGSPGAG
jgi:hypothetical protein